MSERTIHKDNIKTFGNLEDIINSFENGRQRYENDAVFYSVVHNILHGEDLFSILNRVMILQHNNTQEIIRLNDIINKGVKTQYIVATQERIDELKNEIES